ncbi:MAG: VOC family protein [Acidobacteriota bacterium]
MPDVKPIPGGFHTVTPSIVIKDAAAAIEFYRKAFGAEVALRLSGPEESVVHAEIQIGDSIIMLGEEGPGHHVQSPAAVKSTTATLHIYVEDVDAAHRRAVAAGATEIMPPVDMFWGDRFSSLTDPFGHSWSLATHKKDLSPAECQKACDEWMDWMASGGDTPCA